MQKSSIHWRSFCFFKLRPRVTPGKMFHQYNFFLQIHLDLDAGETVGETRADLWQVGVERREEGIAFPLIMPSVWGII